MNGIITLTDDTKGALNFNEDAIAYGTYKNGTMSLFVDLNGNKPESLKSLTTIKITDALNDIDIDGNTRNMVEVAGAGDHAGYTLLVNVNRVIKTRPNSATTKADLTIKTVGQNQKVLQTGSTEAQLKTLINTKVTDAYEEASA